VVIGVTAAALRATFLTRNADDFAGIPQIYDERENEPPREFPATNPSIPAALGGHGRISLSVVKVPPCNIML
jgi:hypothetical protein